MIKRISAVFFLIMFIAVLTAYGGSFNILPLKIFFDPQKRTDVLKIKNTGEKPVTIKVNVLVWAQDEKSKELDVYQPAKDVAFMPRILTIKAGEEGKIKLGYDKKPSKSEQSFRVFIEEVPQVDTEGMALRMALRMSIPIFVAPEKKAEPRGEISATALSKGSLSFHVKNSGNTHFFIKAVRVVGLDGSGKLVDTINDKGWYVLPGAKRPYVIAIPADKCSSFAIIDIDIETDKLTLKDRVNVDNKKMCAS